MILTFLSGSKVFGFIRLAMYYDRGVSFVESCDATLEFKLPLIRPFCLLKSRAAAYWLPLYGLGLSNERLLMNFLASNFFEPDEIFEF